jgi:hypothetical protein
VSLKINNQQTHTPRKGLDPVTYKNEYFTQTLRRSGRQQTGLVLAFNRLTHRRKDAQRNDAATAH